VPRHQAVNVCAHLSFATAVEITVHTHQRISRHVEKKIAVDALSEDEGIINIVSCDTG
jgi:hypothetical protein